MAQLRDYQSAAIKETFAALIESDDPIMFVMSVGGGKSICAGTICKRFQDLNKNVLCLVNSAELVRNNSLAFKDLGGEPSIFCASLNAKDYKKNIVFATPQSVMSAIKNNHPIGNRIFNLIIVDEAQGIAYKKDGSYFMRILRHFKQSHSSMRVLGLSGTPYRLDNGRTESMVGEHALFKKSVANITTSWLIEHGWLAKPKFGLTTVENIDMSSYHKAKTIKNKNEALTEIVGKNYRLTWEILQEVQEIMKNRNGAFVFCSTIAHCHEAMNALPDGKARLIIGSTSDEDRHKYLTEARNKEIKYLVSVTCLLIGVDVPFFDTAIFLRATSSLALFEQAIGRSLRLHPEKKDAVILDYAQNLDRFQDFDHPIINEALRLRIDHEEEEKPFTCYTCGTAAGLHTRRCHGVVLNARCEYFFQFKDCSKCSVQNDITSRHCRSCNAELIDPNAKLTRYKPETYNLEVIKAEYKVAPQGSTSFPIINAKYYCVGAMVYESHFTSSKKSQNIFYAKFLRNHLDNASDYYMHISNIHRMKKMLEEPSLKTPLQLVCTKNEHGFYNIIKKVFNGA